MPVYEYECEDCMKEFNSDISDLAEKLTKTNATNIMKRNPGFYYIEVHDAEKDKLKFSLGDSGKRNVRRFRYKLDGKILYLELRNFKFDSLIYDKEEEEDLTCPSCGSGNVNRVFSTFKAIFDKRDRPPGPGDDLKWHLDYKVMKDEERESNWVGPDYLNQYFNR